MAVGAEAVLQTTEELALGDRGEGEKQTEHGEHGHDRDKVMREPLQRRGQELDGPVAQLNGGAFEEGIGGARDNFRYG